MKNTASQLFRLVRAACVLAAATMAMHAVWAQAAPYPSKPIVLVVPFGAGSATDQLARAVGATVAERLKQPVVVENKGGASGLIASQEVARAAGDGYTVLITTNTTQVANPHLFKKLPYDPVKDFKPVTGLGRGGMVLVVRPDSRLKSLADVIAAARAAPGKLSFGAGNSSSRIAGEMFKQMSGTDLLYVPYRSNPSAMTDLIGGQLDLMIVDTVTGIPQIEGGRLRAIAVSSARRVPALAGVPTFDESGIKGYDLGYWFAAYVPATTPAPVVSKLREALAAAVGEPRTQSFLRASGASAWTTEPEELARFQAAESRRWSEVIKAAGIEPE
ncbi:Tripartite-type tricarboxylate transporter, receptor component TctC [Variovorax sp. PDC80]|uniref:Bug family tripartite tricarboxylate transporter substrate binding protein n=1 Tax=Variovorax sp. PDC80 TaxID=1882827 RepID=UPI0008E99BD9|nr:tripartite tricarboxylate transporter substrate binding protein [Variovorax sp. PDC80]SFP77350.1 Tripartite-type tricarboxylate transporter, receptor component TctC [Variovorax sp. PDC80]